jgi:hypothetical protein
MEIVFNYSRLCKTKTLPILFFYDASAPSGTGSLHIEASRSHFKHTTLATTLLDERSDRRRDIYLTTLKTTHIQINIMNETEV